MSNNKIKTNQQQLQGINYGIYRKRMILERKWGKEVDGIELQRQMHKLV